MPCAHASTRVIMCAHPGPAGRPPPASAPPPAHTRSRAPGLQRKHTKTASAKLCVITAWHSLTCTRPGSREWEAGRGNSQLCARFAPTGLTCPQTHELCAARLLPRSTLTPNTVLRPRLTRHAAKELHKHAKVGGARHHAVAAPARHRVLQKGDRNRHTDIGTC